MGHTWDERYRKAAAPDEPSVLLTSFANLVPTRGRALDLACGVGRNSVWLAERGLEVTGIDSSAEALRQGRELAERRGCTLSWVQADLENGLPSTSGFDVLVCFYYRDPAVYPGIRAALRPGGLLMCETYTQAQLQFVSGPRNRVHLLEPGELLHAFADWHVLFYRETWLDRGVASLIAVKPGARVEIRM